VKALNNFKDTIIIRIPLILITIQMFLTSCNEKNNGHDFFPFSEPECVGVSSDVLRTIENQIDVYIKAQDIVGAELLIIKKNRTVLHKAFGWMNLENKIPMKRNTIFNIRSMTKPLVGTAIFMLLEQEKLFLEDRVLKFIPFFDNEKCRGITIDHLLMHTSGFRSSQELNKKSKNLEEFVIEASKLGPFSEPGSHFYYSGCNSAFLAYIIECITGTKAEVWIKTNILYPLQMKDTFCVHNQVISDSLYDRISHVYALKENKYEKYLDPSWNPEFPYFGGGVGFYSTAMDYAKFLSMWLGWEISKKSFLKNHLRSKQPFNQIPLIGLLPGIGKFLNQ